MFIYQIFQKISEIYLIKYNITNLLNALNQLGMYVIIPSFFSGQSKYLCM